MNSVTRTAQSLKSLVRLRERRSEDEESVIAQALDRCAHLPVSCIGFGPFASTVLHGSHMALLLGTNGMVSLCPCGSSRCIGTPGGLSICTRPSNHHTLRFFAATRTLRVSEYRLPARGDDVLDWISSATGSYHTHPDISRQKT